MWLTAGIVCPSCFWRSSAFSPWWNCYGPTVWTSNMAGTCEIMTAYWIHSLGPQSINDMAWNHSPEVWIGYLCNVYYHGPPFWRSSLGTSESSLGIKKTVFKKEPATQKGCNNLRQNKEGCQDSAFQPFNIQNACPSRCCEGNLYVWDHRQL